MYTEIIMKRGPRTRYVTARAIIIRDGKMLAFYRKRFDLRTGKWVTYFSIPGGQIDAGEEPAEAVVRELQEEMGVAIVLHRLVAHYVEKKFEHYIFHADIAKGEPRLMDDSEEAQYFINHHNQYTVTWVPVDELTSENLLYYSHFLTVIQQLAAGKTPAETIELGSA